MVSEKKKWIFPSAYTVILIVMFFVLLLTYVIPSGKYEQLSYDSQKQNFVVEKGGDKKVIKPATQKTLDDYGIKINLNKFKDGSINKPVAIPNSYHQVKKQNTSIFSAFKAFFMAPIQGLYDSIDIIAFVLVIGGIVGVVNKTGAFTAGINALSKRSKGKEAWLIVIITSLIALGGTTFGLAEETIAFYPIVVPIFIAAGYDAIVAIAAIYLGTAMGTMASTVNPFSVVIASNTAGIDFTDGMWLRLFMLIAGTALCITYTVRYAEKVKKDPSKSLIYNQKKALEKRFLHGQDQAEVPIFNFSRKMMLLIFAAAFVVMVYGVKELGWWFKEMSALFLVVTFILIFFAKLSEKDFVNEFIAGASDLLGVALIIGLARGVTIVMEEGMISDTILNAFSGGISHMNGVVFSTFMFFIYIVLGFFIASSSGMAVLTMPIMAPLADVVGIDRDVVVSAYVFGQGLISFITPTGLILASLAMVNVTYDRWLKFVMPLMLMVAVLAILVLGMGVLIH